jgi:nicotinamidase-related amidase
VVIVRHDSTEAKSTLRPDQPGNALKSGFEPRDGELLCAKQVHSAFIGTPLKEWLDARGVKDITISGISTDMCTSTTTRMGCDLGYRMQLVEDACVCFDQRDPRGETLAAEVLHRAHITTLASDFAHVVRTDQVVT